MKPTNLVEQFYNQVWNNADEKLAKEILHPELRFRGSLGDEHSGPEGFISYMRGVHRALGDYTCKIDVLLEDKGQVAARLTFFGTHQAEFLGVPATGREVLWAGAAFFSFAHGRIKDIWVLGDVDWIKRQLIVD